MLLFILLSQLECARKEHSSVVRLLHEWWQSNQPLPSMPLSIVAWDHKQGIVSAPNNDDLYTC